MNCPEFIKGNYKCVSAYGCWTLWGAITGNYGNLWYNFGEFWEMGPTVEVWRMMWNHGVFTLSGFLL